MNNHVNQRPPLHSSQAAGLAAKLNDASNPGPNTGQNLVGSSDGSHAAVGAQNILSIVGGKGGVGKTAIATAIAIASSKAGQRTLLIDGDLGLANADIILGVQTRGTLADCLFGGLAAPHAIVSSTWGPDLLPAASGRPQLSELTTDHTDRLIALLRDLSTGYDRIIVDTAAGIGHETIALAGLGATALAVTTPDPTAMTDVYAQLKLLADAAPDQNLRLIVNQVTGDEEALRVGSKLRDICQRFMTRELHLDGGIPLDQVAKDSLRRRQPITAQANRARDAIMRLEKRLAPYWRS